MKNTYEAPLFSISEFRVQDTFLLSGNTTSTTVSYDDIGGWSPIKPPVH